MKLFPTTLLLALSLLSCSSREAASAPSSASHAQGMLQGGAVLTTRSGPVTLKVEIALTPQERAKGLMYRKELPEDAGMIFMFEEEEEHDFWMANTFLPLDMIFFDAGKRVVGILSNVPPLTTEGRSVGVPSKYVLEVNAGWAERHGVSQGDSFDLREMR